MPLFVVFRPYASSFISAFQFRPTSHHIILHSTLVDSRQSQRHTTFLPFLHYMRQIYMQNPTVSSVRRTDRSHRHASVCRIWHFPATFVSPFRISGSTHLAPDLRAPELPLNNMYIIAKSDESDGSTSLRQQSARWPCRSSACCRRRTSRMR